VGADATDSTAKATWSICNALIQNIARMTLRLEIFDSGERCAGREPSVLQDGTRRSPSIVARS
jgi:hypothetical protein